MENNVTFLQERFELTIEKIDQIICECCEEKGLKDYFKKTAAFIKLISEYYTFVSEDGLKVASLETLRDWNNRLYQDILPEQYEQSYANPAFAIEQLGEEYGKLLSALYTEMRSMIVLSAEQRLEEVLIRMELFVEVYSAFVYEWQEIGKNPNYESIRQILYWYVSDYSDISQEETVKSQVDPNGSYAVGVLMDADPEDIRFLYRYGEYVTENEERTARFMAGLDQEKIDLMADTYTEGYRMGFVMSNKDLSKKATVKLYYALGFERMMIKAVENFAKMGLKPVIRRSPQGILQGGGLFKLGCIGANPNKQYDYDHKDDKALVWDKAMVQRKLEVLKTAFEKYKDKARLYAGPAVVETFGEKLFEPVNKPQALHLTPEQQKLLVEYRSQAGAIQREYIISEERSFTIIAFPIPDIGEDFEGIFEDVIKINTLDYMKYQKMQQVIIDALDQADRVVLKGMNGNCTDLTINLHKLADPEKETIFENCVADVNIPVGEVFTSPLLNGTNGVLNVSKVYLEGIEFRDLKVHFENGMIKDYSCSNFESEEENRKLFKENVMFHRDTLPLGEFAIGTNTTAYVITAKWGIESKMPILIAEKMGPHFAVGDTCYSHEEDSVTYNPDGKAIVARDNEVSILRKTKPEEAYFDCHTDITIPYDELGELVAVKKDGSEIAIIKNGRFVLAGCEELNAPFTNY